MLNKIILRRQLNSSSVIRSWLCCAVTHRRMRWSWAKWPTCCSPSASTWTSVPRRPCNSRWSATDRRAPIPSRSAEIWSCPIYWPSPCRYFFDFWLPFLCVLGICHFFIHVERLVQAMPLQISSSRALIRYHLDWSKSSWVIKIVDRLNHFLKIHQIKM